MGRHDQQARAMIDGTVEIVLRALPDTQAIYVFGSWARGDQRPDSDLDIALLLPPGRTIPDKLSLLAELAELAELAGRQVDLVELATAGDGVRAQVMTDGLTVFERDPDAVLAWEVGALSRYARYREEIAPILDQFHRTSTAYSGSSR